MKIEEFNKLAEGDEVLVVTLPLNKARFGVYARTITKKYKFFPCIDTDKDDLVYFKNIFRVEDMTEAEERCIELNRIYSGR